MTLGTKPLLRSLVLSACCLGWLILAATDFAAAQDVSARSRHGDQEKIAHIQKAVGETLVDTKDFPREMSLAQFLARLEGRLPEGKKVALRIDEGAFGKQLPQVAGASIHSPRARNMSLEWVLRRALSQVREVELDYGIRPTGVIVTRPRLATHAMTYDVCDVVQEMPLLLKDWPPQPPDLYQDLKATDGPALLTRLLLNEVQLQSWETVEVLNGTRLVIVASPTRHEEIAGMLALLRRLAGTSVVMNARLYEVDRAFYAKQVAPLFASQNDLKGRQQVIAIEGPLFRAIARQNLLLECDERKLRPNERATFLSRQTVFRFARGPRLGKEAHPPVGTGMAGVSFMALPLVSPDRRYLRLHLSQKVVQLIGVRKARALDASTGKDLEVESPNVRKTAVKGTVQIPDGNPILMPVDYQPAGEGSEDKVWLLVARPFIWIDEEVEEIRRRGGDFSPKTVWDSEVKKEEKLKPATRLPRSAEVKEILQAIITNVLTDPDLKDVREFYGTKEDKTLALEDTAELGWPKGFRPETAGHALVEVKHDPFVNERRILGIRLDKFGLRQKKAELFDAPIEVCLFNAGGDANGGVIGGCTVYYVPKRAGNHWTVECTGMQDP